MKTPLAAALLVTGLLALSGCVTSQTTPPPSPELTPSPTAVASWSSTEPGEPELALYDDGTLGGFDGCNSFGGTYVRTGDLLKLQLGYGTLKACIGVDMWLRNAGSAEISDDTLRVYNVEGELIGTLTAEK